MRRISVLISALFTDIALVYAENTMYLWEKPDWPNFTWDEQGRTGLLAQVARDYAVEKLVSALPAGSD